MMGALKGLRELVGPAAVIAAGTMGAGAVAALLLAGAWFRYELLWVVLLMLPLFVVAVDSASRIGTVNRGRGMLAIFGQHIHPSLAWLILLINVPVHLLVAMGQLSVMTSALLTLVGVAPAGAEGDAPDRLVVEVLTSAGLALFVLWLVLSQGYERMQKAMTALMVVMFVCFLLVALRSFVEAPAILAGFVPSIPPDLPVDGGQTRISTSSIIAIVGSAIAPGALLAIPYLSSDASGERIDLKRDLRQFTLNLGVIFGAYAMFVLIAGGFALYPLPDHAAIDSVQQASGVLGKAFPSVIAGIGPAIFTVGLLVAALTTFVICVQVIVYLSLDMAGRSWSFTSDNKLFRRGVIVVTLLSGLLAPWWTFPALLKVVLLMGVNVIVIPLIMGGILYLLNRPAVMGEHTASAARNTLMVICLVVTLVLAVYKFPDLMGMLSASLGS